MNCPNCKKPRVVLGSSVTEDMKQVRTTYFCPVCSKRSTVLSANPRYVPMTAAQARALARERETEEKRERQRIAKWQQRFEEVQMTGKEETNETPSIEVVADV